MAASVPDIATAGSLVPPITEMFGQLHIKRGLQHLLGQTRQQATGPGQLDTATSSSRHQMAGKLRQIRCRRRGSRLAVLDLRSHA